MKCPKCGYNSFEFHDSCKKCNNDLTGYKETYGINPIVLPAEARTSMAAALMAETALNEPAPVASVEEGDMFSFDLPAEEAAPAIPDDPFNFDDEPAAPSKKGGAFSFADGQSAQGEEDAFADLLESTSQEDKAPTRQAPAAAASAGEADLSNFSWDDTPTPAPGQPAKAPEDDFNSLFGKTDEPAKK